MPCSSDGYEDEDRYTREMKTELDMVTRILCEVLTFYENEGRVYLSKEAKEWWDNHKANDLRRIAHEEWVKEQEKRRDMKTIIELKTKWNLD
jgi:hypothetical protein